MPRKEKSRNNNTREINSSSSSIEQPHVISEETLTGENEHKIAFVDQDKGPIKLDSDIKNSNKDIEQTNKTSESGAAGTEVGDTGNANVESGNEVRNEIQSPTSTEYTTPPESSNTQTVNNPVGQEDDTDNDTDERELEDKSKPEKRSDSIPNTIPFFDSEDLSTDDTSKPELKDDSKLAEEKTVCKEENKHEITGTNSESRKVSLSDGESLTGDNSDSSTPHTQTSRVSEGSSTSSGINHNTSKKKVSKSPFANFSKGEKALLLFVALSSTAFIASFISSVLGKPLCPDEKGNLISLAILGTVAIVSITVSLAPFYCLNKSKENDPLSKFDSNGVEMLMPESKKNK